MIYKKLLEFQKQGITVKKGSTNPHFRNTYANLNEVLEKVTKPLNDLGIVIVQSPENDGLTTRLIDTEDDTEVKGHLKFVELTNAQKIGSNLTYYRRYSLVTMLGLEDEDDDGNKASSVSAKTQTEATDDLDTL